MARKAAETGVDGIIVSNYAVKHLGGVPAAVRFTCFLLLEVFTPQQDHPFRSQIDALPEVAKAVQGKCEVYLDGGIRSGTDILKAVGLGAKAVFVGRLPLWGLACNVSRFVVARSACVSRMSGVFNMCFSHRVKMVFET